MSDKPCPCCGHDNVAVNLAIKDIMEQNDALRAERSAHAAEVERLMAERDAAVARAEKAEEALRAVMGTGTHVDAINSSGKYFAAAPDHIGGVTEMVAPDKTADPYNGELGNINLRNLAARMHAALGLLKRQGVFHPAMDSMRQEGFLHGLNLSDAPDKPQYAALGPDANPTA